LTHSVSAVLEIHHTLATIDILCFFAAITAFSFLQHMHYFLLSSAFRLLIPLLFHPIILILMRFKPRYFTYFSMACFPLLSICSLYSGNWYKNDNQAWRLWALVY
jgi:ABC-type bacteriocin/lantibiotic exporter with double-glycine peptidase domain